MEKTGKRYFTQKELEKHINARLVRERKKYGELETFRKAVDELREKGILDADTYAEAAERLVKLLECGAVGKRDEQGKFSADENVTFKEEENAKASHMGEAVPQEACAYGKESLDGETESGDLSYGGDNSAESEDVPRAGTEAYFADAHADTQDFPFQTTEESEEENDNVVPGEDLPEAPDTPNADAAGVISEICNSLLQLINTEKQRRENSDGMKSARRDACSTGFSKSGSAGVNSFSGELTPLQREIARSAGLTYKEYARMLQEIPENGKKRRQYR